MKNRLGEDGSALDLIFEELAAETGGDADLMRERFFRKIHKEQR